MRRSSIISLIIVVVLVTGLLCIKRIQVQETPMETIQLTTRPTSCTPIPVPTATFTPEPTSSPTSPPTLIPTPTPDPTPSPTSTIMYVIDEELLKGVNFVVDPSTIHYWQPTYDQSEYLSRHTKNDEYNRTLLAKLLCCEAGANTSWALQVWTLSAILNNLDSTEKSLDVAAHNSGQYSVAGWVDEAIPSDLNYKAIDYVLDGHRIAGINAFRTKHYHNFGAPIADVEGLHYFSMF